MVRLEEAPSERALAADEVRESLIWEDWLEMLQLETRESEDAVHGTRSILGREAGGRHVQASCDEETLLVVRLMSGLGFKTTSFPKRILLVALARPCVVSAAMILRRLDGVTLAEQFEQCRSTPERHLADVRTGYL